MVRGFNLRWVGSPKYVEVCRTTGEVQRAVQKALDEGLRITVRSGGHCYEDFAVGNEGGVIIDSSAMSRVHRDSTTGLYCVEAGATLWNVYLQLYRQYGVTLPGGSCYSVGAGGHVTGGGHGTLSRRDGLTVDYVAAVELVHVTAGRKAEAIVVRRDAADPLERELCWAHLGGGGGNFGIVTRFWFKDLPVAPVEAVLFELRWDWRGLTRAEFTALVRAFGEFMAANSGVGSPYAGLHVTLGLTHRSASGIGMEGQYVGDRPELCESFVRTMEEVLPKRAERIRDFRRMPWLFAAELTNASGPRVRAKHKSAYMNKPFPDGQIDVLWDFLSTERYANSSAVVSVSSHGARTNAVPPHATAVAQRSSILLLQYQSYWLDAADDHEHLRWMRELYDAMYGARGPRPDGIVDGCYVNYPDVDLADWQSLYYKDGYPRLRQVKGRLDPLDVFHHRQSIELPR